MSSVEQALDRFFASYNSAFKSANLVLRTHFSPEWPSKCATSQPYIVNGESAVSWQPVLQAPPLSFAHVEEALEIRLDDAFKTFFSRYWSENLNAKSERGSLQLLQVWNHDDGERLKANLIAHIMMKRRLKQRETLFFAITDEEDFTLSILNETGEVVLEQVGCEPKEVIASSLSEFLLSLTPVVIDEFSN